MMYLKHIGAEIKNNRSFTLLFIFNLSLGLCGFIAMDTFKQSIASTLSEKSKVMLGADFGISARRPLSDQELALVQKLGAPQKSSSSAEVFSMVATAHQRPSSRSVLAQVKSIEQNFPFYGEIATENKSQKLAPGTVWVYPEILAQLELKVGDSLKIGDSTLKIVDVITNDPSSSFSTSMAARVYITGDDLSQTGLVKTGSLARYSVLYQKSDLNPEQLKKLRDQIFTQMDEPDVNVFTHETSSEQISRLLSYLNDFLGLTSLVALFLSAMGSAFLAHSFLQRKTKEMAILISLGLTHRKTFTLFALHILLLGLLSAGLSLIIATGLFPFISALTQGLLPFEVQFHFQFSQLFIFLIGGVLGSFLILLPLLLKMRKLRPSLLLHQSRENRSRWDAVSLLGFLPVFIAFFLLSLFQTQSYRIGFVFFGAFMGSGLIFFGLSYGFLSLLDRCRPSRPTFLAWGLRDLTRYRLVSITGFLTLGLGVMLMNVIPQVQASLQEDLHTPEESKLPSLFLFDIQEEQVNPLKDLLEKNKVPLNDLSPLIRARLMTVNGQSFEKGEGADSGKKTLEERQEAAMRNRGFNLSYREGLSASETLIAGSPFSKNLSDEAEISVEKRFAERLNLKIGDHLVFDVQSVPVKAKVINLRAVKWTSFQPNFFIIFQPGFLEGAPKTYLATLPRMALDKKNSLQNQIVQDLPNVSLVDVTRTMERISQIISQMSWALQFMSLLNILVGLVVLYSLASHQAHQRQTDIGLLKALGSPFAWIQGSFLWPFLIIALAAGLSGVLGSFIVSYLFSKLLFENIWVFNATAPLTILSLTLISSGLVTYFALRKHLSVSPQKLLAE